MSYWPLYALSYHVISLLQYWHLCTLTTTPLDGGDAHHPCDIPSKLTVFSFILGKSLKDKVSIGDLPSYIQRGRIYEYKHEYLFCIHTQFFHESLLKFDVLLFYTLTSDVSKSALVMVSVAVCTSGIGSVSLPFSVVLQMPSKLIINTHVLIQVQILQAAGKESLYQMFCCNNDCNVIFFSENDQVKIKLQYE